jgi:hypothetical protein
MRNINSGKLVNPPTILVPTSALNTAFTPPVLDIDMKAGTPVHIVGGGTIAFSVANVRSFLAVAPWSGATLLEAGAAIPTARPEALLSGFQGNSAGDADRGVSIRQGRQTGGTLERRLRCDRYPERPADHAGAHHRRSLRPVRRDCCRDQVQRRSRQPRPKLHLLPALSPAICPRPSPISWSGPSPSSVGQPSQSPFAIHSSPRLRVQLRSRYPPAPRGTDHGYRLRLRRRLWLNPNPMAGQSWAAIFSSKNHDRGLGNSRRCNNCA